MAFELTGDCVRDVDVAADYANVRELELEAIHTRGRATPLRERLCSFDVDDVLVTAGLVPIDLPRARLFLNQTYAGIERMPVWGFRGWLRDGRFGLPRAGEPVRHAGRHVLIGGPIDGVWYHWLYNWAPRLLLLRKLRPELWGDPEVRFIVEAGAMRPQFRAVIDALGVPAERLTVVDLARDHRFEQVTLLPFLHHDQLFPDLLREFAATLGPALAGGRRARGARDLFLSRQALPAPKRRIANFDDLAPVLARHDVRTIDCGALSASEQARALRDAARVVAAHGSDLANLMFCRPGTQVLIFEHAVNLAAGGHVLLRELCRLFDLRYDVMIPVSTAPAAAPPTEQLAADYRVNAAAVDAWLARSAFVAASVHADRLPPATLASRPSLLKLLAIAARLRA